LIGFLETLVELVENVPAYILYAIESFINVFFNAFQLILEGANALLGGLPEVVTPPKYVGEINWYYPLGEVLSVATPMITAYVIWLGISWIYRKYGAL
jgi:hypothetical protein